MRILKFIEFVLFIIAVVGIVLFIFDQSLFFNILYHIIGLFYSVGQTVSGSKSNNPFSGIVTTLPPYYENKTVKEDLAGIEHVIPANQIKAVRTFVNPTTDLTQQMASLDDFEFSNTNNTAVYYNGTYAPAGLFATGDIYNNGTFTNYMPWLEGKIVYVQFPVGSVGWNMTTKSWNPPKRYVSLPYLVTKVYEGPKNKFYYNFTQAFEPNNPILVNAGNQPLSEWYNRTNGALGFYYNGIEYIVQT